MSSLYRQAEQMARAGYGADDIHVKLSPKGLTRYDADLAVFGSLIAMRREARRVRLQTEREAS